MWEGHEVENGQRWQIDLTTVCECTSGKVTCQTNVKGKNDLDYALLLLNSLPHLLTQFIFVTKQNTT